MPVGRVRRSGLGDMDSSEFDKNTVCRWLCRMIKKNYPAFRAG